ncbi:MAG: carboxypeptidase-like regulatory domain-containing protein [Thermogemmata sp.]|uniref:Carboxypeptidase regulatory-like domain-containing protein n=1 Tax=Thermogemmata fonticola TaxID=2755323 RepID=A0A7V9ABK1_9BACT|nr:carboxypeptidase-like regulatory domain-containing protein [Thermogemmata fonticola]MBA2226326.1 carboxypeptidase regulatory-like domain-containing protein [Thermogemmata fonticola]MCX8139992.1 carboxypeptidase-like regulatory domain-containing protein [Gemmataceae bacterium]
MGLRSSLQCHLSLIAGMGIMLLSPDLASAHALEAIVRVTNTALVIEAGYDDDTPAPSAKVVIRDANQRIVFEGTTDDRGLCTFSLPPPGMYVAEVTSTGHRASVEFVVENAPGEYQSWRPNRRTGLFVGIGGLLVLVLISWWRLRRRQRSPRNSPPMDANQEGGLT